MNHGHLRTLCLAALRVHGPATCRQVCETIADGSRVTPSIAAVMHSLRSLVDDGMVTRTEGMRVVYRLT